MCLYTYVRVRACLCELGSFCYGNAEGNGPSFFLGVYTCMCINRDQQSVLGGLTLFLETLLIGLDLGNLARLAVQSTRTFQI